VDRVVINDFTDTVFFARLIIIAENELDERKIVEIDARPSDSIALAVQAGAPIYVAHHVWESVEDMSIVLKKMQDANNEADEGFPGM
jgi:bifunctional DNase/RNase